MDRRSFLKGAAVGSALIALGETIATSEFEVRVPSGLCIIFR